jgi:hypothetical protein
MRQSGGGSIPNSPAIAFVTDAYRTTPSLIRPIGYGVPRDDGRNCFAYRPSNGVVIVVVVTKEGRT